MSPNTSSGASRQGDGASGQGDAATVGQNPLGQQTDVMSPAERPNLFSGSARQDSATAMSMGPQDTSSGASGQGDAPTVGQNPLGQTADVISPAERPSLSSTSAGQFTNRTSSTQQSDVSSVRSELVQSGNPSHSADQIGTQVAPTPEEINAKASLTGPEAVSVLAASQDQQLVSQGTDVARSAQQPDISSTRNEPVQSDSFSHPTEQAGTQPTPTPEEINAQASLAEPEAISETTLSQDQQPVAQGTEVANDAQQSDFSGTRLDPVQSESLSNPTDQVEAPVTQTKVATPQETDDNRSSIVGSTLVLVGGDLSTSGLIRETAYSVGKSKIAQEGIKELGAAGENLTLDTAKAIAAKVVDQRNLERALVQEKLAPIGRIYSNYKQELRTLDLLVAKKGGESIETYKAIVEGAGKGRESVDATASISKGFGTAFAFVGGAISAYSLYGDYQRGDVVAGIGDVASVTSSGLTIGGIVTAGATGAGLATAGTVVGTFGFSYAVSGAADKLIESYTIEKYGKDYSPSGLIGSGLSSADQAVSKLWTDPSKPAYTQTIGWKLADWLGL